jgi:hypothetical protein
MKKIKMFWGGPGPCLLPLLPPLDITVLDHNIYLNSGLTSRSIHKKNHKPPKSSPGVIFLKSRDIAVCIITTIVKTTYEESCKNLTEIQRLDKKL